MMPMISHQAPRMLSKGMMWGFILLALAGATALWGVSQRQFLDIVPVPPHDALQRTFDLMIPNGTAMVAYVLEDDKSDVHASIIAVKRDGNVDTVSTHLGISDIITGPEFARDWKRERSRSRPKLRLLRTKLKYLFLFAVPMPSPPPVHKPDLVCPECLGRDFSRFPEMQKDRFLFFTRTDAYIRHECDRQLVPDAASLIERHGLLTQE